jgi:hypothetical protein
MRGEGLETVWALFGNRPVKFLVNQRSFNPTTGETTLILMRPKGANLYVYRQKRGEEVARYVGKYGEKCGARAPNYGQRCQLDVGHDGMHGAGQFAWAAGV